MADVNLYQYALAVISVGVMASIIAGCVFWVRWFVGISKFNLCGDPSKELITRLPKRVPGWTIFDSVLMFGMMILVASLLAQRAVNDATSPPSLETNAKIALGIPEGQALESDSDDESTSGQADGPKNEAKKLSAGQLIRIQLTANVIAAGVVLMFIRLIHQIGFRDMGIIPTLRDVRRGVVATFWILAPVLLINVVVAQFVQYEHTVTDMMEEHRDFRTLSFLFLSAAIVTPIVEEFQFRMLLQGGLQKLADPALPNQPNEWWNPQQVWPILVTSALFAGMHLGQGAAPVPLFFLSVGLGFLYRNTGRLTPVIVVHMLLNGTTLCMEFARSNAVSP